MTITDRDIALDEVDRGIILFVHRHRKEHGKGPLWREVRDETGLPSLDFSVDAFLTWWDAQGPDAYPSTDAARRAFKRAVRQVDPLADRLYPLRRAGYLKFGPTERSLDVGWRVTAWAKGRRSS
jgi:hypothetical protein